MFSNDIHAVRQRYRTRLLFRAGVRLNASPAAAYAERRIGVVAEIYSLSSASKRRGGVDGSGDAVLALSTSRLKCSLFICAAGV